MFIRLTQLAHSSEAEIALLLPVNEVLSVQETDIIGSSFVVMKSGAGSYYVSETVTQIEGLINEALDRMY